MGQMVIVATGAQSQPSTSTASGNFNKGTVYIQAEGAGSGAWGATFNVAPVSPAGVVGSVKQYAVSNVTPMVDADVQTGASMFIGWWTNTTGTITYLRGSVDG